MVARSMHSGSPRLGDLQGKRFDARKYFISSNNWIRLDLEKLNA
jgi:hypothetical protein